MNIVISVSSCYAYRDTWEPFFRLKDKYWKNSPLTYLLTDHYMGVETLRHSIELFVREDTWNGILRGFAEKCVADNVFPLIILDDFWLTAPVDQYAIDRAAHLMVQNNAGCVRLFPCPGPNSEMFDSQFGAVYPGTDYRISLQVALWNPRYLMKILDRVGSTAWDFEIQGTKVCGGFREPVLAWKREVTPWPLEYVGAMARGKWNPVAKEVCDREGIVMDWEKRGFAE